MVWSCKTGLCEQKQIENYGSAFLAGRADLNRCTWKRGSNPLKKARGGANLQPSQKTSISRACETKLGCVLSFLENAIKIWKISYENNEISNFQILGHTRMNFADPGCEIVQNSFFLPFTGAGADKLLKFKKWFWSIVEKMSNTDRQDLVGFLSWKRGFRFALRRSGII